MTIEPDTRAWSRVPRARCPDRGPDASAVPLISRPLSARDAARGRAVLAWAGARVRSRQAAAAERSADVATGGRSRSGRRGDGVVFTLATRGRLGLHEVLHPVYDVRGER